jgi:peptidoglycan hydrolase-like protein with peptidoglycan-binding domain
MNPVLLAAGAATLGFLGWKKFKKPSASDYQSVNVIGAGGVPIKVTTPVPTTVTRAQATAVSAGPPKKHSPVPTTVPGKGAVFAPPNTLHVNSNGDVLQPAPIIVSPAGAASIAIGSVKDVQHALNTLGFAKPALQEDNKLGPKTIAAIRAFQSKNHLAADGNAGPATRAALSAALTQMAGGNSAIGATVQAGNPASGQVRVPPAYSPKTQTQLGPYDTAPNRAGTKLPPAYTTKTQTELGPYDTAPNQAGGSIDTKPALAMSNAQVQHALNLTGATPKLAEDGKLGPRSVAAIKSFQAAHGLIPDGVAGAKTKTALYLAQAQATH